MIGYLKEDRKKKKTKMSMIGNFLIMLGNKPDTQETVGKQ